MANDMVEDEVDQVFRGVSMALMNDEGRLKRVHDSTVTLEVCPRQYEAQIRVVKGSQLFRERRAMYMNRSGLGLKTGPASDTWSFGRDCNYRPTASPGLGLGISSTRLPIRPVGEAGGGASAAPDLHCVKLHSHCRYSGPTGLM